MKEFILIVVAACLFVTYVEQQSLTSTHKPASVVPTLTAQKPTLCTTSTHPANRNVMTTHPSFSLQNKWADLRLGHPDYSPIQSLSFEIKKILPKPFNDTWAKLTTIKKLHKAGDKDGKLDYVLKISKKMHLPASVAVVPIVESNYRSRLISHKGAAGVWQLMPETARDYGIKLEERFQLAASTKAALHLLKDLHEKFNNWELAYAAYNAGGKRVFDAIKKNPKATSLDELDLPRETKEYVHRLKKINQLILRFANVKADISRLIADLEY